MEYNGIEIIIIRKYNKNTYFRYRDNAIYVTTNKSVSDKDILNYIQNNFKSLSEKLIKEKEDLSKNEDGRLQLFGKEYNLEIKDSDYFSYSISDDTITLFISNSMDNNKAIRRFYKTELKKAIVDIEFKYKKEFEKRGLIRDSLSIKKMSTRWGSCNKQRRSISMNELLAKIDIKYLEYVLCHEYAHLEQANHSKDFYILLEKLYPEHEKVSKELKSFSI